VVWAVRLCSLSGSATIDALEVGCLTLSHAQASCYRRHVTHVISHREMKVAAVASEKHILTSLIGNASSYHALELLELLST
jgi:hypothetical protein